MARVNHKKIKQLIVQKQKTITDRQFFISRALAAHFEDIAAAQTRRCAIPATGVQSRNILSCFSLTRSARTCWAVSVMRYSMFWRTVISSSG